MPCAIAKHFHRETFHTLAFCDIFLNQKSIDQCILSDFVFFGIAHLGCPCCFSLLNFIVGKGLLDVFSQLFDTFYIILVYQATLVGWNIQ